MAHAIFDTLVMPTLARTHQGEEDSPSSHTGRLLWGGTKTGLSLLDYLTAQGWLSGSHILSLGAGLGAFELVAAAMGGHVVATDLDSVMPLLKQTIEANPLLSSSTGSIRPCVLDWGEPALPELVATTPFDFICASDCVHFEEWRGPLLQTLSSLSAQSPAHPPTVFLFIEARSPSELAFLDALEGMGFTYGLLDESHSPALSPTTNAASAIVWARRRPTIS